MAAAAPAVVAVIDLSILFADDLSEKLKLLDYEEKFCSPKDIVPFSRTYFSVPASNTGVQFQHFLELFKFLMRMCHREFVTDKFDDPNTIANKIMLDLKGMGFDMDFAANKLKQAAGEHVCRVLLFLADRGLETQGFVFQKPSHEAESTMEEAVVDEEAEIPEDDEEVVDEDEDALYADTVEKPKVESEQDREASATIVSTIDPIAWKTELVRVGPKLQIKESHSTRTWRAHFEQAQKHAEILATLLPDAQAALTKISSELSSTVERVVSKERYINSTFGNLSEEYKSMRARQDSVTSDFQRSSVSVSDLTNEMAAISDALEDIKSQTDSRGSSMTDTSPLLKIKQALTDLKLEIKAMELRIGVVGHTIMQSKIRHKPIGHKEGKVAASGEDESADFDIVGDEESQY